MTGKAGQMEEPNKVELLNPFHLDGIVLTPDPQATNASVSLPGSLNPGI
jgi:hypothetical protein